MWPSGLLIEDVYVPGHYSGAAGENKYLTHR